MKMRTFRLPDSVIAYLDNLPKGRRSEFVVDSLQRAIALRTTPKEKLLIERDQKLRQLVQLEAELQFIDTTLGDFDREQHEADAVRRRVEVRLLKTEWRPGDAVSVRGWRAWAGEDWPQVEAILRERAGAVEVRAQPGGRHA